MEFVSLQSKIHNIVERMPEKIAIEYGTQKISYFNLECKAMEIARFFQKKIKEQSNVITFLDRSPSLIYSLLGIIQAGMVFVPIEPSFPLNRIKTMLTTVGTRWVISESNYLNKLNQAMIELDYFLNVLLINPLTYGIPEFSHLKIYPLEYPSETNNLKIDFSPKRYAYIYFTSGSTGTPKGVLGRHRSLTHFIDWETKEFGVTKDFKVSQLTIQSFDPFLRDVFLPLCSGATLCIPESQEVILNASKLIQWIEESQITLIHMVPSLFKIMISNIRNENNFQNLKYILLAGELLRGNDIKPFFELFDEKIRLINLYGPTETTLAKFCYWIPKNDQNKPIIPVGKPIDNTEAIILDPHLERCPIGVIGEVYIRTPFISSGYYQDPDSTRKLFIKNPFTENPNDIIYKTGDLGVMLPDGNMIVNGRVDHQVKIRGIRIELGEIENQLLNHADVKEAVVIVSENSKGIKYLMAYIVSHKDIDTTELKEFLLKSLPNYMIPTFVVRIEKMPLNANGKINRGALPVIEDLERNSKDNVAPTNEYEKNLISLWEEIFGTDRKISIKDSFFEIGGNSLYLVKLMGLIEDMYPGKLKAADFFAHPTVEELAKLLQTRVETSVSIKDLCFPLPQNFFKEEIQTVQNELIEFVINDSLYKQLNHLCVEEGISIFSFLLSMYIYLLNDITENNEISVITVPGSSDTMIPVIVDFAKVEDFSELFTTVSQNIEKSQLIFDISNFQENKGLIEKFSVLTAFCNSTHDHHLSLNDFNIIFQFDQQESSISISCHYNAGELRKSKLEELLKKYQGNLNLLAKQYQFEEKSVAK